MHKKEDWCEKYKKPNSECPAPQNGCLNCCFNKHSKKQGEIVQTIKCRKCGGVMHYSTGITPTGCGWCHTPFRQQSNVFDLDSKRQHVTINWNKKTQVIPVAFFEDIIAGKTKLSEIDDIDDFMPKIIEEWLACIS